MNQGDRILRVNHAGEHGAVSIYSGQILMARFTAPEMLVELKEFKSHEKKHRAIFLTELERRSVNRCHSYWLCAAGGFTLGVITGLLGRGAILATTVAVERVVLKHLKHQLAVLIGTDEAAVNAISKIVEEEQQHHDRSAAQGVPAQFWPKLLTPIVSVSTESVIWLGMHL